MKGRFVLCGITGAALLAAANSAFAWNDKNCQKLCQLTAVNAADCIVLKNCSQYRGNPPGDPARLNAFAKQWNGERGTPAERRQAGKVWDKNGRF